MKNNKILSIFLLVVVITMFFVPLFSISSSAVEVESGYYIFNNNLHFNDLGYDYTQEITEIDFYCNDELEPLVDMYSRIKISVVYTAPHVYTGSIYYYKYSIQDYIEVYNSNTGWVDYYYCIYAIGNVTNSATITFLENNTRFYKTLPVPMVNAKFYLDGYEDGYNDGVEAEFGDNLIGKTISAPIDALKSFVLYESSGGYQVTLFGVFGAVLALSLFIAFLKMFAGG